MILPSQISTLFPYTTLFRSTKISLAQAYLDIFNQPEEKQYVNASLMDAYINAGRTAEAMKMGTDWLQQHPDDIPTDRKSTRLNSSHANISYAVFCLKKKKKK